MPYVECDQPREYSCARFVNQRDLNLLHFAKSASEYLEQYKGTGKDYNDWMMILSYLATYPLRVSCSIKAENTGGHFIEEYILPQTLLLWIRENKSDFDGISYLSSKEHIPQSSKKYNIVLPAKNINLTDGYCDELRRLFKIDEPTKTLDYSALHKNLLEFI